MTFLYDFTPVAIEHGRARITPEGYFVADALVGRANNIQEYRAAELGDAFADRDPNSTVRVFRPEAEVFAVDSLRSASRLPVTLDHPVQNGRGVMVDAKNWREFAKGETGEQIMRDGEFIRVPIRVTDAAAVDSVRSDRQEFSLGYSAEIRVQPGVFDGQAYDAELSNIRYNHLAACRAARGGPELRITDERPADKPKGTPMLILIDGLQVDVSNAEVAATTVRNLIAARDAANTDAKAAETALADARNTIAARDAEIVTLKDAADKAKPTPAALRDAAAAYARVSNKARALGVTVTDEMDVPAMQRAAVSAKMGDAAAAYAPEQVAAAFDVLAAQVGDAPANVTDADPLRTMLRDGQPANLGDASKAFADARAKRFERYNTAHKGTASA